MIGGQAELAQEKAFSLGKLSLFFVLINWANIDLQQLRRTHLRHNPYVQHTILFKHHPFLLTLDIWFLFSCFFSSSA